MASMAIIGSQLTPSLRSLGISMKTVTPGLGNLLATIDYYDGDVAQSLNISLALTAGNAITNVWPDLWCEAGVPPIGDFNLTLTYLGAVSGTCLVRVAYIP